MPSQNDIRQGLEDRIRAQEKTPLRDPMEEPGLKGVELRRVSAALELGRQQEEAKRPMSLDEEVDAHLRRAAGQAVKVEDIEARILSEHYFTAADGVAGANVRAGTAPQQSTHPALGCLLFCVLVMKNRHRVTGFSAVVDPANFDEALGRKLARRDAVRNAWSLEAYLLAERRQAAAEGKKP